MVRDEGKAEAIPVQGEYDRDKGKDGCYHYTRGSKLSIYKRRKRGMGRQEGQVYPCTRG
jgi:hypothetical protein